MSARILSGKHPPVSLWLEGGSPLILVDVLFFDSLGSLRRVRDVQWRPAAITREDVLHQPHLFFFSSFWTWEDVRVAARRAWRMYVLEWHDRLWFLRGETWAQRQADRAYWRELAAQQERELAEMQRLGRATLTREEKLRLAEKAAREAQAKVVQLSGEWDEERATRVARSYMNTLGDCLAAFLDGFTEGKHREIRRYLREEEAHRASFAERARVVHAVAEDLGARLVQPGDEGYDAVWESIRARDAAGRAGQVERAAHLAGSALRGAASGLDSLADRAVATEAALGLAPPRLPTDGHTASSSSASSSSPPSSSSSSSPLAETLRNAAQFLRRGETSLTSEEASEARRRAVATAHDLAADPNALLRSTVEASAAHQPAVSAATAAEAARTGYAALRRGILREDGATVGSVLREGLGVAAEKASTTTKEAASRAAEAAREAGARAGDSLGRTLEKSEAAEARWVDWASRVADGARDTALRKAKATLAREASEQEAHPESKEKAVLSQEKARDGKDAKGGGGGGGGGGKKGGGGGGESAAAAAELPDVNEIKSKYDQALQALVHELSSIRGSTPNPRIIDHVMVDVHGAPQPLPSLAHISLKGATMLLVSPFDPSTAGAIEKAIVAAGTGLNPSSDGAAIRVPLPKASKEVRDKAVKQVGVTVEKAKARVRRVRQDAMDGLKKVEGVSSDEVFRRTKEIEAATKTFMEKIDAVAEKKKKEVEGE